MRDLAVFGVLLLLFFLRLLWRLLFALPATVSISRAASCPSKETSGDILPTSAPSIACADLLSGPKSASNEIGGGTLRLASLIRVSGLKRSSAISEGHFRMYLEILNIVM